MHLLITSDTVGGVWTYSQELVTGLIDRGHRVTLVSFGKLPLRHQTAWMETLPGLDYRPTEYRLEWMQVAERDLEESMRYLELVIAEVEPDVLHFSQYCYGELDSKIPKVVVAHSDIVSWWVAVHGREPEETPWMRNYRDTVARGLRGADRVVAPSRWMLQQLSQHYLAPSSALVIHNGRTPALFEREAEKEDFVLSVGRLWDPAKNVALLLEPHGEARIRVAGWDREPDRERSARTLSPPANVELLGPKSQEELRHLYARAAIYAASSRYEPFGLAPLEAAFSGCALVLNENPVFQELWEDSAVYFHKDDAEDLRRTIRRLRANRELRDEYRHRAYQLATRKFTAEGMVDQYQCLYQEISSMVKAA
jgi:glycogen synthase